MTGLVKKVVARRLGCYWFGGLSPTRSQKFELQPNLNVDVDLCVLTSSLQPSEQPPSDLNEEPSAAVTNQDEGKRIDKAKYLREIRQPALFSILFSYNTGPPSLWSPSAMNTSLKPVA
jgi:hypothetical protein